MTVWFWDASFHTEDNWGIQMQLLQKIQTLTDAPEGKTMHLILQLVTSFGIIRISVINISP